MIFQIVLVVLLILFLLLEIRACSFAPVFLESFP